MTGYGDAQCSRDGVHYALELRSVNHRYLKIGVKVPEPVQFVEPVIERVVRERLTRGSISLRLRIRDETATAAFDVNPAALAAYVAALEKSQTASHPRATIDLATLSTLPGVCQMPEMTDQQRQAHEETAERLAGEAIDGLLDMRRREGRALHDDLVAQCRYVGEQLESITTRAPVVLDEYRERLQARVAQLLGDARLDLDRDSIHREVALYAERCDISEEITRERAHVQHFIELCDAKGAVGRKLDFLAQEMLREANTIGSKSNDAAIARCVVELKSIIDRVKEQVQNVE